MDNRKLTQIKEQGTDLTDLRLGNGEFEFWVIFEDFWRHSWGFLENFWCFEATTASKQPRLWDLTSDLKSVTSITYISMCILLICFGPILWPLRPLQPPKQPRRSDLTSNLKSVTSITYIYMCILLIWCGPFWQPRRPLRPPNSLRAQSCINNKNDDFPQL